LQEAEIGFKPQPMEQNSHEVKVRAILGLGILLDLWTEWKKLTTMLATRTGNQNVTGLRVFDVLSATLQHEQVRKSQKRKGIFGQDRNCMRPNGRLWVSTMILLPGLPSTE
jgi:hypothetical protein